MALPHTGAVGAASLGGLPAAVNALDDDLEDALGDRVSSVRVRSSLPAVLTDARAQLDVTGAQVLVLALLGLRARTPETTAGLSTVAQGWGYLLAACGPLLVGVLHGATGGYTGMFVLVLAATVGLGASGLLVTRNRYVDDELHGLRPAPAAPAESEVVEVAGAEPPVTVHLREPGGASPRG